MQIAVGALAPLARSGFDTPALARLDNLDRRGVLNRNRNLPERNARESYCSQERENELHHETPK